MSRFNASTKEVNVTTNHEGEKAYKLSPELELYAAVCCASLQPKFYVSNVDSELERIRRLIAMVPPEFVSRLAIYAREEMHLRSIPLVLVVELAKIHSGDSLVADTTERVIQRADEITELLAYYQAANNRSGTKKLNKLSKQIQKGIVRVFGKFDEYQFAKYNRKSEVTFKDAVFLTHPKKSELIDKIINDTLETPYTWEVELSTRGNGKEVWEELIDSKKVGYMATLRNIRNILQAGVSAGHLKKVAGYISNKDAVLKSRQLPFRYLSAYQEISKLGDSHVSYFLETLEEAVEHSAANIEGFGIDTTVVIACDVSGSMEHPISERSTVQYYDIGLTLGMLLQSRCKSVISGIFGDDWKVIQLPRNNILSNVAHLHSREGEVGYSTNGYKVIDYLADNKIVADKVMMFTDCQLWDSSYSTRSIMDSWQRYKTFAPDAMIYLFDLAGHGTSPLDVSQKDVSLISGWSDKVFGVLAALEKGQSVLERI